MPSPGGGPLILSQIGGGAPPAAHAIAGAEHTASTLASFNTKISDATLIDTGDSRLSDARTPTAHLLGGAEHSADILANLNTKISDATLVDRAAVMLLDGTQAMTGTMTTQALTPDTDGTRNQGAAAFPYGTIFVDALRPGDAINFLCLRDGDGDVGLQIEVAKVQIFKNLVADSDNSRDIGEIGRTFRDAFVRTLKDSTGTAVVTIADAGALTFAPTGNIVHNSLLQQSIAANVTADPSSVQGGGPITTSLVQIATVTTIGDAVTLPPAVAGEVVTIENNGANSADVFPATGGNINGGGLNLAEALPAGEFVTYYAFDGVNWSTLGKTYTGGGGGDLMADGSVSITGVLRPDTDLAREFGLGTKRFSRIHTSFVRITSAIESVNGSDMISISDTGVIFNINSLDVNVVFKGQGEPSLLTLDAGLKKVGVGRANALQRGKLDIDQSNLTAAMPVLVLDQADLSEEMINFVTAVGVGNPIEAVGAKSLTPTHFVRVTIPSVGARYFEVGTIA